MNFAKTAVAAALGTLFATTAFAQNTSQIIERDVNQQQRIYQGLNSGQLTVQEAARLQGETSRIDRMESRALSDGRLSPEEASRISRAQDRVGQDIRRESSDAQTGNPNSRSSERMQADVQRNINQDRRIAQGVQSGQLSNREVSQLEREQAMNHRGEARAGADGHIGRYEQRGIQGADNRFSRDIRNERHDGQFRGQQYGRYEGNRGWNQGDNRNYGQNRGWAQNDNRGYGYNRGNSDFGHAQGNGAEQGRHLGWNQGNGGGTTTTTGPGTSTPPVTTGSNNPGRHLGWNQNHGSSTTTTTTGSGTTTPPVTTGSGNSGRQYGSGQGQRIAMANTGGSPARAVGATQSRGGSNRR